MKKEKMIYISVFILSMVIVFVTYFSYAYLTKKDEQHGKINVIVGTLEYSLISSDLNNNNTITLSENEEREIEIVITSLNSIDSKYELYYYDVEDVEVGYLEDEDEPVGTINQHATKTVKVKLLNNSSSSKSVTFGVKGSLINNEIELASNMNSLEEYAECRIPVGTEFTFDYTGNIQTFNATCDGSYKLEAWGASGGGNTSYIGGYGAYSTGILDLNKNDNLYIAVGEAGKWSTADYKKLSATYNGGGAANTQWSSTDTTEYHGSGGGATHIAKVTGTLADIGYNSFVTNQNGYMVAAGGGGAGYFVYNGETVTMHGGNGGGINGVIGTTTATSGFAPYINNQTNTAATQTSPSTLYYANDNPTSGSFGAGGSGYIGGGSGLYGGTGTAGRSSGGSSYIGNSDLYAKKMVCKGCTTSTATNTYTETNSCTNETATSNCSKIGDGYVRITYLGDGNYEPGTSWTYDYTGNLQEFNVLKDGVYKLEAWGAQGGHTSSNSNTNYGGYSTGIKTLSKGSILKLVVGESPSSTTGGYNGGGTGLQDATQIGYGGGGATHIALKNNDSYTTLASYGNTSTAANYVLLVAAGGGGTGYNSNGNQIFTGGYGGGTTGGDGAYAPSYPTYAGHGATQSAAGSLCAECSNTGSFGKGGNYCLSNYAAPGGGAGWYGGSGTSRFHAGAGGGSSYVGGVTSGQTIAGNSSMPTHDGTSTMTGNSENGYAKITYLGNSLVPVLTSASDKVVSSSQASASYYVFDNNDSTLWSASTKTDAYVGYHFDGPTRVNMIALKPSNTSGYARVKNFKVEASNDADTWTTIYTGLYDSSTASTLKYYDFSNDNYYTYYRVFVVDNYATQSNMYIRIDTLKFYGETIN